MLDALLAAGDLELAVPDAVGAHRHRSCPRPPSVRGGRVVQVRRNLSPQGARAAVSRARGRAAHRRRASARVAGAAEAQDRDARRGHDRRACGSLRGPSSAAGRASSATRWRRSSRRRASTPRRSRSCSRATTTEVRRLAVLALSGSGSAIEDEDRIGYIRKALSDSSYMVRLEAVRAWTRRGVALHGCQPLLDALNDQSRARRPGVARCARRCLPRRRVDHQPAGVGSAHAAAAGTVAARSARLRVAGQARPGARRDRHADVRHAPDLAGADVRRPGGRDRRRRRRADAAGVGCQRTTSPRRRSGRCAA